MNLEELLYSVKEPLVMLVRCPDLERHPYPSVIITIKIGPLSVYRQVDFHTMSKLRGAIF